MACNVQLERRLLHCSTVSSLLFSLMGIGLGQWMGSLVIVFDGAYSLVSLVLTLVSLVAAAYIRKPVANRDPEKLARVEPMVIAFKGLVITMMCCVSFISAVKAIHHGGRDVDTGLALAFGVINVVGCFANYWFISTIGKKAQSGLVDAEVKQWLMDTVISGAVLVGFVVAKLLALSELSAYASYADPVMVVIASIYFVIVPLKMMFEALSELQVVQPREPGKLALRE
ncbi:cation transporter [Photobacterium lipolyticum]|uniref:Cation transporter n=1 Tax=Photobacterium lipolyticum TaxID=266810 RepID=A0A2T3N0D5_9GAMM|nr:cation transporter [Photobacterium lipolyticum]PSW05711.1 cation transporter [Photobacterium lipolyticum]